MKIFVARLRCEGSCSTRPAFIAGAGDPSPGEGESNLKLVPVRIPVAMLARIDHAAKRLGLTRSGLIVMSTAERLTRMEAE